MANLSSKDKESVLEVESFAGTKIYPGTAILTLDGRHGPDNEDGAGSGEVAHLLVPQPSNDIHDPLNWSPLWKTLVIICACLVSLTENLGPLAHAPLFGFYIEEFNCTLADAVQFTGVAILILGFSNFIWIPMANCFGRRPVMLISSMICFAANIWRARATSYNSFMGASVLNGLGAGPCQSMMPLIITDIIFLKDRGKYQTLYFTIYFGSLMLGNVISGAMAQAFGWRSFWWLNAGLLIFTCLMNLFFFPETRYQRQSSTFAQTETAMELAANEPITTGQEGKDEKATAVQEQNTLVGHGKPSKKQFKPWAELQGSPLREIWMPIYLHSFPIVEFSAFVVSFSASGFLIANLTQQQVFAAPPYNFSPQSVGLTNLALFAGAIVGLLTSGPLSDWIADYLTKRNRGIREAEMRLVAMIPYTFVMIIGCTVVGVGYERQWPWQAIIFVGYVCLGMQVTSLPSIASTYAVDCYKPATGSVFVTITINKNLWGYGFGKFITPWVERSGFIPPILTTMGLITFFCMFGIVFWHCGKYFRGLTKDSFVHSL